MLDGVSAGWGTQPSLQAGCLKLRNVVRRWPLACAALAACVLGLSALGRVTLVREALAITARAPVDVLVATTFGVAVLVLRRRRRLASNRHRDWLAAVPGDLSLTARAVFASLPLCTGTIVVGALMAVVANVPPARVGILMLAIAVGYIASVAAVVLALAAGLHSTVLLIGSRRREPPRSRYTRVVRIRREWASRPRLRPLGDWPVAQARFADRPRARARNLILLLLALPLGISGGAALAVAAAWLILMHLVNLLIAVVRVAFAASWWLAPTPVSFVRFSAALSHRALAGQILTCALLTTAAYAIPGLAIWHPVLAASGGWVGAVSLVSITACLVAQGNHSVARSVLHRWIRS